MRTVRSTRTPFRVFVATAAALLGTAWPLGAQAMPAGSGTPVWPARPSPAGNAPEAFQPPGPVPEPTSPAELELPTWQLWFGYQAVRYEEFRGGSVGNAISDYDFWTHGFNFTVTRFFNKWLGLDAGFTPGWGHTTAGSHLVTQSFDFGAGPRFALRARHHLEPYVRTSVGLQYFHFNNSGSLPSSLTSFKYTAGAGSAFKLSRRIWWNLEVNYMGTHFFANNQKDVELRTQVVFNF